MSYDFRVLLKFLLVTVMSVTTLSCVSKSSRPSPSNEESKTNGLFTLVPPFQTKEPEKYSAVRTITSSTANGQIVSKELVARNGALRRNEIQNTNGPTLIYLETQSGRFLLLPEAKLYADITNEHHDSEVTNDESEQLESTADHVIHATTPPARYLKLGDEVIDGHNCTKYRVVVNTSDSGSVTNSETSIWIDDSVAMPVKSETISGNGSTRMELSNVRTDVQDELFSIPKDYEKVDPEAIRKRLKSQ